MAARPEEQPTLCDPSHPSAAYDICEETCGKCTDNCEDEPTGRFFVNGVGRNCEWLMIRPQFWGELCVPENDAWDVCMETCNNCPEEPTIAPIPTQPTTPRPTRQPTVGSTPPPPTNANSPPTRPPTPSPTAVGAAGDPCDDDITGRFFVSDSVGTQQCFWLASRPDEQAIYCHPGHPSGAYDLCEETCRKCVDDCIDDATVTFQVNGVFRNCAWLMLRPQFFSTMCVQGQVPFLGCQETCNNCIDDETPPLESRPTPRPTNPPPSTTPAPILPTRNPTPLPTISGGDNNQQAAGDPCDDDPTTRITVDGEGDQQCIWLAARPEQQQTLCSLNHPSNAYNVCVETCGKCTDNGCEDDPATRFDDQNGVSRNCAWLALRPQFHATECVFGKVPFFGCQETCDNCVSTTAPQPTPQPVIPPIINPPVATSQSAGDPCDDDPVGRFFVSDEIGTVQCRWLAARPAQRDIFCHPGSPSGAYDLCPETCGKCTDNGCVDDSTVRFDVDGVSRNCLWLSVRPGRITGVCLPGSPAFLGCQETCNNCVDTDASSRERRVVRRRQQRLLPL